jgi:hypothetical protein
MSFKFEMLLMSFETKLVETKLVETRLSCTVRRSFISDTANNQTFIGDQ